MDSSGTEEETAGATTVYKFRHLLEEHNLGEQILGTVTLHLRAEGGGSPHGRCDADSRTQLDQEPRRKPGSGDASNAEGQGGHAVAVKQWYFGMKAHVGKDSKTKIIATPVATAANVSDAAILPDLLHGEETRV